MTLARATLTPWTDGGFRPFRSESRKEGACPGMRNLQGAAVAPMPKSPEGFPVNRSRLILGIVLAVVIIVILAAVAVFYLGPLGPAGTGACSGTQAYSGTVTNDTGIGVAGVVVGLAATLPKVGTNATVTTTANGAWSATLSGVCAYTARYFWQSASAGPRLAVASNLDRTSTQTVHVSWMTADLTLLAEYSHDANATIDITVPQGLSFFVDANASGSIATGFLDHDDVGNPGYNFTAPSAMAMNGTAPWAVVYRNATAYRIQDENGNGLVYAAPSAAGTWATMTTVDALNRTAAIADSQNRGLVPYVQVPGRTTSTIPYNVTNVSHELVGTVGTFFGSALQDFVTVRTNSTLYLRADLTLVNSANRSQCYVVDAQGAVLHVWFYGTGNCP